jgi:hypothetical protein
MAGAAQYLTKLKFGGIENRIDREFESEIQMRTVWIHADKGHFEFEMNRND